MRSRLALLKRLFPAGLLFFGSAFAQVVQLAPPPARPPDNTVAQQLLSPQDLQNLVAPIALYPDPLLSQVLAATTYPLEVIEAQQWVRQAGNLRGQELVDAAKQQNWDPSVQALVAFPDVLALMTSDIRWTRALGDAFLNQQADVMSAIQTMRASARSNGRLQSTPQQQVTIEQNLDPQLGQQQAIEIQPTDPQVIYPPAYDPGYVWGPPAYGAYPDLYYPDYGFSYYPPVYLGSYFGGFLGYGGWGWGFNWFNRGLYVNTGFFNHYGFHHGYSGFRNFGGGHNQWAHDPGHRQGIPYSNRSVASRFNGGGSRGGFAGRSFTGQGSMNQRSFNQGFNNQRSFTPGTNPGTNQRSFGGNQGFRSFSNSPSQPRAQGFRNFSNSAPQSRAQQNFRGFSSPSPQRSSQGFRSMPQQSFRSAPQSAPRASAPQFSGGGGGGFRGGGGGGARGGGGGGGGSRGSGGGGGGHRR